MLSDATFKLFTPGDNLDVTRTQKQNSDSVWVSLAALGSCQLHFDNVSWQCLLACRPFNLCFNKQQIFGRFPRKQTWPAMECCSSSAVDLRFCWSVPRSGARSGWSLLLFCQKATKKEQKRKLLECCIPVRLRTSGVNRACGGARPSTYATQWLCNEKPSRCWLGAVPRYWKVVASCFQIVSFAENTSVPLAPRALISQPILLLFCLFSCSWIFVQNGVSDFFYSVSKFSGVQKKMELA